MESFNMTYEHLDFLCQSDNDVLCMLLYIFLSSMTVVTVFGNLLVVTSIIYFKQLHTPTNCLILSLAVADLLMGGVVFPSNMTFSLTSCLYNNTMPCKIRGTIDFMISISSILNLCCISVDRYYAVCQPLLYRTKITDNAALTMSLGSWFLSVLGGIFFFVVSLSLKECDESCFIQFSFVWFLTFCLPTIILVCIYCKILLVAKRQARNIQNMTSQFGGTASHTERKSAKTMAIIMGLYLLCWMPLFICYPYQLLSNIARNLIEPFNWFALSNSMFNPFIYAFFYRWFRSASRMIISGKIFKGDFANTTLH